MLRAIFLACLLLGTAAADSVIRVTDFGARPNDKNDDTEAIQAACDAAKKRLFGYRREGTPGMVVSAPEIRFPHGKYRISRTIKVPAGVTLRGEGTGSLIEFTGNQDEDVFHIRASKQLVEDLIFIGGRHQLTFSNANIDNTMLTLRRCQFRFAAGFAVRVVPSDGKDHMSSLTLLDGCTFSRNHQCIENNGDLMHLRDCWMELKQPEMIDGPAIVNRSGKLMMTNLCGVPCANPPKGEKYLENARWIDNYGALRLQYVRFGGEGGGIPAVYNFADGRNPISPLGGSGTEIIIENSSLCVGQIKRPNKGVLRLFELPSQIRIEGNFGSTNSPMVILSPELEKRLKDPAELDHRLRRCFRYTIKNNLACPGPLPAVLRKWFTADTDVPFARDEK
ncbi:MAG: hypothetical protein IJS01_00840 [Lentisphaeria bacterium]|nr:hypothetical protein [Lentisphaeria bacterium]